MPPVKTVASSTDVDNDATAELPVLDVAAYEATLDQSIASTDTWTVPVVAAPVVVTEAIPTLLPADAESTLDLSATHEMPAFSNKVIKATPMPPAAVVLPAPVLLAVPAPAPSPVRVVLAPVPAPPPAPVAVTLPPSPPLIEEWRAALAAAERRIEELVERARIAD